VLPQYGDNKITFKLTDRHNNKATTDVFIARVKGITSQHVVRPEYRNIIKENTAAKSGTKIKPEELVKQAADTLAKTGQSKDISADTSKSLKVPSKCMRLWYLWLLLGGGIILFFIFFRRKQKKDKSS
jgi:hypothetical protein